MKRVFGIGSLIVVAAALTVGCDRKASTTTTERVSGPGGTTETTVTKTVESSGENPPANSSGEAIPPAK